MWGLYFAWRYSYYGLLLPTTYYAKTVVSQGEPDRGIRQAWDFLRDYGLPLCFVPLVRGPRREALGLSLAVLLQVGYATTVGGDWMPFNRFFLPIVPLAAVLAAWGASELWRSVERYGCSCAGHHAWPCRAALVLCDPHALGFDRYHARAR